jgi:hypothetical protein
MIMCVVRRHPRPNTKAARTDWARRRCPRRLGPADDLTEQTAIQIRGVVERLVTAGRWTPGDPDVLIVFEAGYDVTRLAFLLADREKGSNRH